MRTANRVRAIGACVAAAFLATPCALAAAPFAATQAPGYYRMQLGDFEITALSDGHISLQLNSVLRHVTPARISSALQREHLKDPVDTSVSGFLINTGSKLVLIDTGTGSGSDATLGKLLANLQASGYQPGQVDEIYITHMHGDHIGGLVAGEQSAFPNALVRADRREADYWLSQQNLEAAPPAAKGRFQRIRAIFEPLLAAGRFRAFDGGSELLPGIRALPAYGHTPGHSAYLVESRGERLLLWGDLMHAAAIQFGDPDVTISFDSDAVAATAQRRRFLADAARQGYWVGGAHLPFPGLGHVDREGRGYRWIPAPP